MDVQNGSDSNLGTAARPFKTITRALTRQSGNPPVLSNNDTISIAPGAYEAASVIGGSGGETFPLSARDINNSSIDIQNLTIVGTIGPTLGTSTTIRALVPQPLGGYQNYQFSGAPVCLDSGKGWTISGLVFEHSAFQKMPAGAMDPIQLTGIRIRNLPGPSPSTDVRIINCQFLDGYIGVHVVDNDTSQIAIPRNVLVSGCLFTNHGPVKQPAIQSSVLQTDRGHQAILTQNHRSMTLTVAGSTFVNNHDGIESGNGAFNDATILVTRSTFDSNENGFEVGGGALTVAACSFVTCAAKDPFDGGVGEYTLGALSTSAIGIRSAVTPASTLTVRTTTFDRCQIGLHVVSPGFTTIDLGTDSAADPGANKFLTDVTVPWPSAEAYRSPCCGICTRADTPILAMGNLWTYDSAGDPFGYNQQALPVVIDGITYGSYDGLANPLTFGISGAVNFNPSTSLPPPRPTSVIAANPNTPWNVSTGPSIVVGSISVFPTIRVR